MPLDPKLDFNFTPAQQAAIHAALDAALLVLSASTVPYVNLTKKERKKTHSINAKRMPYVQDAVTNILPVFPGLASPSIPLARAATLFDLVIFLKGLEPKMAEFNDRITYLGINAENLVYKSVTDSYSTAKKQGGRMPGADVLVAAIAPLFAAQGGSPNREEPPRG